MTPPPVPEREYLRSNRAYVTLAHSLGVHFGAAAAGWAAFTGGQGSVGVGERTLMVCATSDTVPVEQAVSMDLFPRLGSLRTNCSSPGVSLVSPGHIIFLHNEWLIYCYNRRDIDFRCRWYVYQCSHGRHFDRSWSRPVNPARLET